MTTVAHELGHAWHHEWIKDRPYALTTYPMTLAETASNFAETIVSEAAIAAAAPAERLFLLETHLQDGCQVIVDILSRYHFEKSVFEAWGVPGLLGKRNGTMLRPRESDLLLACCDALISAQALVVHRNRFRMPYQYAASMDMTLSFPTVPRNPASLGPWSLPTRAW